MDHYYFEHSNMQRYASAKDELQHLITTIYFNAAEIGYYLGFLPIKFIKPDTHLHFDPILVLVVSLACFSMTFTLMCTHFLHKRAVEMQFNAKMCGAWEKVPKPSKPVPEWRPHTSYAQGTIVSLSHEHHSESNGNSLGKSGQGQAGKP